MVFRGEQLEDKLNPEVKVEEISESEIDIYNKLMLTIFKMPMDFATWEHERLRNRSINENTDKPPINRQKICCKSRKDEVKHKCRRKTATKTR